MSIYREAKGWWPYLWDMLEAVMIAALLSVDTFLASFAYGSGKIKIPMVSAWVVNIICSVILGCALLAGSVVRQFIPENVTIFICFIILFVLGVIKLLDGITKEIIRKHARLSREIKFSMFNLKFILKLYADPEAADVDISKDISPLEAAALAVSLSLDGIAVGFGAAIGDVNVCAVLISSFIIGMIAVISGFRLGNKIAHKLSADISWLCGAALIIIAFMKLI